jgi:hypothetical protein
MDPNIPFSIAIGALFTGLVYGFFTVRGSGIAEHPYVDAHGSAPGAERPSSASGRDAHAPPVRDWSRGTR